MKYQYSNEDSHLQRVTDGSNKMLWEQLKNVPGREQSYILGNSLTYNELFSEDETQRTLQTIGQDGNSLLTMTYELDPVLGNVISRREQYDGKVYTENFAYDEMDRLTDVSGSSTMHLYYASNGNISSKSDMGDYRYNAAGRSHALIRIDNPSDALKQLPSQKITYTEFNKVSTIEEGNYRMVFTYDGNEERVKSELYNGRFIARTIYYGAGYEKHLDTFGKAKEYTYVDSDDGFVGMSIKQQNGYFITNTLYYFHTDLLNSVVAISDEKGNIVERRSYDAWGRRRNPYNWSDYQNVPSLGLTLIGYISQEEMPEFGLINLNGRLYDPMLGE